MKRRCRSWKSLIPLVLAVILLGISVNTGILPALADPAEENALNALAQEIPAALPEEVEGEGETIGAAKEALADPAEENAPNALAQETPAALPEEGEGEEETKGVTKKAPKIAAEGPAEEAVEPTIAGPSAVSMTYGDDGKTLSVTATAAAGHIITGYQWYHNTTDSNIGGTAVSEATSDSYTIPQKTPAGPHYYYCVVSTERTDNGQTTTKASSAAAVTIEPATLTVKAVVKSKDYGGTDPALNYTVTGFKAGDNILIMSGRLERETGENAGNYRINQGTLSAGSNYTISYTGAYFKINPVRLTVKAEAMSKTYGDTDPELTYTVTGLKNGDTESVMTGELARKAGESIGSYAISQGTLSAGNNYTMSYTGADFTIDPARLTVTADTKSKTYGDNDPELTYTVSGFKNGDTESVMTGELAREAGEDAGKYAISQGTLSAGNNYTMSYTGADFTIDPARLTVTADTKSKTYGDNDPELTYTVNGFKNGDTESVVSGEPAREAGEDAGDYAIIQGTATAGDNYTIICTGTALTIDPAPLTVTTPDAEKVYDGTPLAAHGKLEGLVSGETATLTSTGTLTEVGTAPNTYVITWDGTAKEGNYVVAAEELGTLTVTEYAEEITVTTTGGTFTYDGKPHGAVVEVSGLPEGYMLDAAGSDASSTDVTAEPMAATADTLVIKNAAGIDVTKRLNIKKVDGAITITPAELTVTTESAEKVYDGTPLMAPGKLAGLVNGETVSFAATGTLTEAGTVQNTYDITWDGTANESNYTIVSENLGTLTVTEAPPVSYKCVEGDNSSWQKEDAAGLRFVYKRPVNDEETFSHFTGVNVDGKKIAETAYDAAAGSVVITLKAEYLNGLKPGKHTFEALFDDGDSDTIQFTVAEKAEPTPTLTPAPAVPTPAIMPTPTLTPAPAVPAPAIMQTPAPIKPSSVPSVPKTPATGDENQPLFWLFWLLAGACGVIGAFAVRRRKKA